MEIYCDGACSGNPGPSAVACVVLRDSEIRYTVQKRLEGEHTCNQAEYTAIITALNWYQEVLYAFNKTKNLIINSDSKLAVEQINKNYKIHDDQLHTLCILIREKRDFLQEAFDIIVNVRFIPREENKEADKLAKSALKKLKE